MQVRTGWSCQWSVGLSWRTPMPKLRWVVPDPPSQARPSISLPSVPGINTNTSDVIVIGAGIVGLAAAHALLLAGNSVRIVEQSEPGIGQSTRIGRTHITRPLLAETSGGHPFGRRTGVEAEWLPVWLPEWLPAAFWASPKTHKRTTFPLVTMVGREGLEPPTPCASCRCSSQLS